MMCHQHRYPCQFSSATYNAKETANQAIITVTLGVAATEPVTVSYVTSGGTATDGDDYAGVSGTLHFDIGEVSQTFTVPIFGDAELEGNETIDLTLSNPINAVLGIPDSATLTVVDNVLFLPLVTRSRK